MVLQIIRKSRLNNKNVNKKLIAYANYLTIIAYANDLMMITNTKQRLVRAIEKVDTDTQ